MPFGVRPRSREEAEGGYTPLSTTYKDTIDQMVRQLAHDPADPKQAPLTLEDQRATQDREQAMRSGAALIKNDPRTPSGVGVALREALNSILTAADWTSRTAPGVTTGVVANPRHQLSQWIAKTYPKIYEYMARETHKGRAVPKYQFRVADADIEGKSLEAQGAGGITQLLTEYSMAGGKARPHVDLTIHPKIWELYNDPRKMDQLRRTDPALWRDVRAVIEHELQHALGVRYGKTKDTQLMPFDRRPDQPLSHGQDTLYTMLTGIGPKGEQPARVAPRHIQDFFQRSVVGGEEGRSALGHALVERAGENLARTGGRLKRQDIGGDLPPQLAEEMWRHERRLGGFDIR